MCMEKVLVLPLRYNGIRIKAPSKNDNKEYLSCIEFKME